MDQMKTKGIGLEARRPRTALIRRGKLMAWLEGEGLRPNQVRKLIEAGVIQPRRFPGASKAETPRAFFVTAEVAMVLEQVLGEQN